jgi:hypothetical protein
MMIKKRPIRKNIILKSTMRSFLLYGISVIFTLSLHSYPNFARAESMPDEDAMGESINLKGIDQAATVSVQNGEVILLAPGKQAPASKIIVSKKPKTEIAAKKEKPKPAIAAAHRVVTQPKKEIIVVAKPKPSAPPFIAVISKPIYISSLQPFMNATRNVNITITPSNMAMKSSAGSLAKNISITPSTLIAFNNLGGFLNAEHNEAFIIIERAPVVVAASPKVSQPTIAAAKPIRIAAPPVPMIVANTKPKSLHLTPVIVAPPKQLAVEKPKISPKVTIAASKTPAPIVAAAKPVRIAAPHVPPIVATAQTKALHLTPVIVAPPKQLAVEKPKSSPPVTVAAAKTPAPIVAAAKPVRIAAPPVPPIVATAQPKALHLTPVIIAPLKQLAAEKLKPSPPITVTAAKSPAPTVAATKPVRITAPPVPPIVATAQPKSLHLTPVIVAPPKQELAVEKPKAAVIKSQVIAAAIKPTINLTPVTLPNDFFAVNILNRAQKTNADLTLANAWKTQHPAYLLADNNYIAPPHPTAILLPEENIVTETRPQPSKAVIVHEVSDTNPAGAYANENVSTTSQEIDYSALDETNEKGIVIENATPPAVDNKSRPH